jgi:4-alpha-glucanotransferase
MDRYYEIPAGSQNAINGEWIDVPSDELFSALNKVSNKNRVIAEDLGIIDDGVIALLEKTGYSGMAVLSFAFNGESDNKYLPENIKENTVCYTGTHDNDTLIGLITSMSEWDKNNLINGVKNSLKLTKTRGEVKTDKSLAKSIIRLGAKSKARLFIVPLTDLLLLDGSYRMNEPGAENQLNWCVKLTKRQMKKSAIKTFARINEKYDR